MLTAILQSNPLVSALTAPVALFTRQHNGIVLDCNLTPDFAIAGVSFDERDTNLFFGSVAFLKCGLSDARIRSSLSWLEDAFTASKWREWFGSDYLGSAGRVVQACDVADMLQRQALAVRPNLGLKGFQGGIYSKDSWRSICVEADFECFVAPPSIIKAEYRVWLIDSQPVAASRYRFEDRSAKDHVGVAEAIGVARNMVGSKTPLPDIVVDLATTEQGWKIIEFNCIHTSGWHAVDPDAVLEPLANKKTR